MGITSVVLCDCCGGALASAAVTDATIVTYIDGTGEVVSKLYGRAACTCSAEILAAIATAVAAH